MSVKLTKVFVDKITPPESGQKIYWDDDVKGFGLRVTPTRKTYIVQSRVDGKTVRKTIGLHGVFAPEQSRVEAKKQLGLIAGGVNVNQKEKDDKLKKKTLREAFEDYKKSKSIGERTKVEYERAMRMTFGDWQEKPLVSINRDLIEKRFKEVSQRTASIANSDFRFLRALINFAMEKYAINGQPLIPSNPCNRLTALKLWNRIERKSTYISPDKFKAFYVGLEISKTDSDIIKVAKNQCMFIWFTGCREQEGARLKWQDVSFKDKTVTFTMTKNHKKHVLPMGEWLTKFLERLYTGQDKGSYIFPANNKAGHIKDHRKYIKDIADKSGVAFSLHDIRRTFASIINHHLGQSFTPYTIKRLLNHSQQDVTAGYIQFGIDDLRKPMQMIEDFILVAAAVKKPEEKPNNVVKFKNKKGA